MVYDLRKRPDIFWSRKEDWVHRSDSYDIAKTTCEMVWEILKFNWIDKETVSGVDLWAGTWIHLKWFSDIWMKKIFWVDWRPRSTEPWINIKTWRVEDLWFIKSSSLRMVFSCNLFDARVYNQNIQAMLDEIHRILYSGGLYFWAEYQEEVDLYRSHRQIAEKEIPGKGVIRLQVIRKWPRIDNIIPPEFI